ncbi:hypothetical protein Fmac_031658 [Flemingia macrophylla]|uniref:YbaK/aminoacyl-tRNA synthetase-associated domain-containing protein n=1 Tax=Flemingia macrophylla TaxID=520843 RepID=A0ABD1L2P8_9FABA
MFFLTHKVPLGCVTPFAVMNESARDVSLLLDQGFKTQEHCFFHPLSNDMTISKVVNPSVSGKNTKEKAGNKAHSSSNYSAVELFVEEILHKTLRLLLSEIKEDSIKQHGENLGSRLRIYGKV